MMKSISLVTLSTILVFFSACQKNGDNGNAGIHTLIKYENNAVESATVYVKFDAVKAPSSPKSEYNKIITGNKGTNHVHIDGLNPGKYYLYAVGLDTTSKKMLEGGTAVIIKWTERNEMKDSEILVTPVQ